MNYDHDKVDEAALALLFLTLDAWTVDRAWKGMAWEVSDRLYQRGWIENPRNKDKSLTLTQSGREACIQLFKKLFWEPVNAKEALFPLYIDMELLLLLHHLSENDPMSQLHYLDRVTGAIVRQVTDEEADTSLTVADASADPRYLRIPVQSDAEYMGNVREYAVQLQQGELKSAILSLVEQAVSPAEMAKQSRTLLMNHEKWAKWHAKRSRRRLLAWLAAQNIELR